jgi:hypothetical protein
MDVALISSPVDEAREKLEEYLTAPGADKNPEWQRIATAYQSLAKGTPLIVLTDVLQNAPRDARLRPRLAIARADQVQVRYRRDRGWQHEDFIATGVGRRQNLVTQGLQFVVPTVDGVTPAFPRTAYPDSAWRDSTLDGYSLVPIVPPSVRQRARGPMRSLATHYVLWEVEAWADTAIRANPDVDPYLLERIADDLFAVVGEWDLTDVERAVMRDRARS